MMSTETYKSVHTPASSLGLCQRQEKPWLSPGGNARPPGRAEWPSETGLAQGLPADTACLKAPSPLICRCLMNKHLKFTFSEDLLGSNVVLAIANNQGPTYKCSLLLSLQICQHTNHLDLASSTSLKTQALQAPGLPSQLPKATFASSFARV